MPPSPDANEQPPLPDWVFDRLGRCEDIVGALLYGSRALGHASPDSDIDLLIVLDGSRVRAAEPWHGPDGLEAEVHFMALEQWLTLGQHAHWQNFGWSRGRPVVDPHGFIRRGLEALRTPPESYRARGVDALDSYLNSTYRSVKAWRRGDAFGARLHAGIAVTALLDGLFRLAGHWTPYWDRLEGQWEHLAPLGLDLDRLRRWADAVVTSAEPDLQIELYDSVAAWMRLHGHASVLEAWPPAFHETMRRSDATSRTR